MHKKFLISVCFLNALAMPLIAKNKKNESLSTQNPDSLNTQQEITIRQATITHLQQENASLQNDIDNLDKQIKSFHNKNGQIKPGKTSKVNNRRAMMNHKKDLMKHNQKQIEEEQNEIDTLRGFNSTQPSPTTNNPAPKLNVLDGKQAGGGTVICDPITGQCHSLGCEHGACPLAMMAGPQPSNNVAVSVMPDSMQPNQSPILP